MTTLLRIAQDVRARDAVVDPNLGVAQAGEVFHSHVSASSIEAVCLLMIDSLDLETLMKVIPRRRFVGVDDRALAMRPRRNGAAWFSVLYTAGTELPPRSRITTKTLRFPMALKSDRIAAMPLADGRSWRRAALRLEARHSDFGECSSCACASANVGHKATASMKSASLHEANVRSPPRSPQTVAHDAAFPHDIHDILLTFLFLRQPASAASRLLRRAVSCLF